MIYRLLDHKCLMESHLLNHKILDGMTGAERTQVGFDQRCWRIPASLVATRIATLESYFKTGHDKSDFPVTNTGQPAPTTEKL